MSLFCAFLAAFIIACLLDVLSDNTIERTGPEEVYANKSPFTLKPLMLCCFPDARGLGRLFFLLPNVVRVSQNKVVG